MTDEYPTIREQVVTILRAELELVPFVLDNHLVDLVATFYCEVWKKTSSEDEQPAVFDGSEHVLFLYEALSVLKEQGKL